MDTSKTKKPLSLVLAIIMLFTMIPTAILTSATSENLPVMKSYDSVAAMNNEDYHGHKAKVVTVNFPDEINYDIIYSAPYSWDVTAALDASVMTWMTIKEQETALAGEDRYDVYIAGNTGISASPISSNVFCNFINLNEIRGFENFKTYDVTTLYCFLEKCSSLKSVDLRSFDTSNVANMSYAFTDCNALEKIDVSGRDTSKVTNMQP